MEDTVVIRVLYGNYIIYIGFPFNYVDFFNLVNYSWLAGLSLVET
jgi:hypothetical protein